MSKRQRSSITSDLDEIIKKHGDLRSGVERMEDEEARLRQEVTDLQIQVRRLHKTVKMMAADLYGEP